MKLVFLKAIGANFKMTILRRLGIASVGKDVDKRESSCTDFEIVS